jgi:uncharacterized MAPEG superfamily protein
MTILLWTLLAFAGWTLLILGATHAPYRWGRILTGRARFDDFGAYRLEGDRGWYVRGMRAHANCIENLPVFAAIVVVATAAGIQSRILDVLAIAVVAARIPQTIVHVLFEQTNLVVGLRSLFFMTQWICMSAMVGLVALA